MNESERWAHLVSLDEELLLGGVILSEWCSLIVRETDIAFAHGANLAAILTAVSGIESYLRSEYASGKKERLANLIDFAPLQTQLKSDLHVLRRYRNKWVHVEAPWSDEEVLEAPEIVEEELEQMACAAVRLLRQTVYENQWA